MTTIKFYDLGLNKIELQEIISSYELSRWYYTNITPIHFTVTYPDGEEWRLIDCVEILKGKLIFGNEEQTKAIDILKFFNVLQNYYKPYLKEKQIYPLNQKLKQQSYNIN